jgi:hypothetical protein
VGGAGNLRNTGARLVSSKVGMGCKMRDRKDRGRDRAARERDRARQEEEKKRRDETERRGEELREAWRQHHPERGREKGWSKKDRPSS